MLGDIRSAKKLLQGLDADDLDNLKEAVDAANEITPLVDAASELSEALNNRIEYLKAMGQTIETDEENEEGQPVG